MKILVTGVAGQLGYEVVRELNKRHIECIGVDRSDFDITDADATEQFIKSVMPDAVIHCSAYTAVDTAEENEELCLAVNVDGTANIARVCKAIGAKMLYISTDYVFGGDSSSVIRHPSSVEFREVDDETHPCNVYGQSKLDGELAVKSILDKYFIVRTSWVFGHHGKNFVETMLRLGKEKESLNVVNDQIGSPTFTEDLAVLLADMIVTDKYGTYHATNDGFCSWAKFAAEIMKLADLPCKINPILSSEYLASTAEGLNEVQRTSELERALEHKERVRWAGTSGAGGRVAKRPLNSRLSKKSLDENGFKRLPEWQDALERYLAGS